MIAAALLPRVIILIERRRKDATPATSTKGVARQLIAPVSICSFAPTEGVISAARET
jgi:hypothetical protein